MTPLKIWRPLFFGEGFPPPRHIRACNVNKVVNYVNTMSHLANLALFLSTLTPPQREQAEFLIFTNAVAQIESGGNFEAQGDRGKAVGAWQMHIAAWITANQWRKAHNLPTIKRTEWKNKENQRAMAGAYLYWCKDRLIEGGIKNPSYVQIYIAFAWGYSNFKDVEFDLSKVPAEKLDAAERVNNITQELLK